MTDSLGAIREWLRSRNLVGPTSVYFSMPEQQRPELPLLEFKRVGGYYELGLDQARIVINCWGATLHDASFLAHQVAKELDKSQYEPPFIFDGGQIDCALASTQAPRPGTSWAKRIEVQTTFIVRFI